jgi:hypothetical protein
MPTHWFPDTPRHDPTRRRRVRSIFDIIGRAMVSWRGVTQLLLATVTVEEEEEEGSQPIYNKYIPL